MKKTLKKILTLVLSAAVLLSTLMCAIPVTAATADRNTDFMVGNYGIMVHYLHEKDEVQAAVDSFDADAFAKQVNNAGAKWVLFTLTQSNGVYNIPMDAHYDSNGEAIFADTDVSVADGEKDIVEKLYDALTPYGVKLMLYWIPGAPSGTDETSVALAGKLGATERSGTSATSNWKINDTVATNMSAIMKSVSEKYGNKIVGWWIDGCYDSTDFNSTYAAQEAAALRAGNANAVVAFNRGTQQHDAYYDVESYAAGEICHGDRIDPTKDNYEDVYMFSADSRWTEKHFQSHYLTFLGSNWTMGDERYTDTQKLVNHIYNNILKNGGAMTLDMSCSPSGGLDPQQLNQVIALSKLANKVETELSVDFENYNPFGWIDNVYKEEGAAGATDHYSNDSAYVQLATGDEALNGNTSLKVLPAEGNTRTDIVGAATVPSTETESGITFDRIEFDGNADFDKADAANGFDKVSGIMLRLKLTNDGDAAHAFRFATYQDGLAQPTTLGRLAKLYAADGSYLGTAASADAGLSGTIPAGFDGFVFMPFTESRSGTIVTDVGYGNYNASPEVMVDFSQNFRATIWLNSSNYNGATVYIDDINFYYGNTDADAWNTMRALGYDVLLSEQPDVYTLPINGENLDQPITSLKATAASGKTYVGGTATLTSNADEILSGKYSIKIHSDATPSLTAENKNLAKVTTNSFTVEGISELSTEKIQTAASDSYAYLKLRIKIGTTAGTSQIIPLITQNGSYWVFPRNVKAYNADGTANTSVTSNYSSIVLPTGFDGYLYMPIYSMESGTLRTGDNYITCVGDYVYRDNLTTPSLDQDFSILFQFIASSGNLNDTNIYLDDMDMVISDGNLPLDFDNLSDAVPEYYGMNQGYGRSAYTGYTSFTGADDALNGGNSLRLDMVSSETNGRFYSGPRVTLPGIGETGAAGIMVRVKLENDTATAAHNALAIMLSPDGEQITETIIGCSDTKLYYADGTPCTNSGSGTWSLPNIPVGFDGFVFFPFNNTQIRNGTTTVDVTQQYVMHLIFWNASAGNRTWDSVESVVLDDISYYTVADTEAGLTDVEAWDIMRGLGYTIYKAEQPATYELPIDFEGYETPFDRTLSNYGKVTSEEELAVYPNGWPTKTDSNALAVGEDALTGNASLAVTVPTIDVSSSHVWARTNYANVKGINGLDKETLSLANKDYAYLKVRIKTPDTNDRYDFRFYLKQSDLSYETVLSNGAYAIDDDGYYFAIATNDLNCYIPGGFEGDVYFPISKAMATTVIDGSRPSYRSNADLMVDMTQDFQMCIQLWGANAAGQTFIIDDMEMVVNVLGDINGDNQSDGTDLVIMQKQLLDVDTTYEKKCDIKEDSAINILDFIKLKKIISK